jgi:1,4-alpha-glucan branching enzyme/maltooligosyltrehalose trehalohydrolase
VRDFFIANALYWIEEYRFDGLRVDAVHAIADDSPTHIVEEIARALHAGPARGRRVHLVLENDRNQAGLIDRGATAQWNDDAHHALHVLLTGETDGYYVDYARAPAAHLARTLAEGFAWQGEPSEHRKGERRGEASRHLPLTAFIPFLQNHDQVGNRALGERLSMLVPPAPLRVARAVLLLAPSVPMLFMGEEFAAATPFLYFCDFKGDLARAVREGRRREFAAFSRFADEQSREQIPDPGAPATFVASRLDWESVRLAPHAEALAHTRELLALRAREIVPRLARGRAHGEGRALGAHAVSVDWSLGDEFRLHLRANLGDEPVQIGEVPGKVIHLEGAPVADGTLPPWSASWSVGNR